MGLLKRIKVIEEKIDAICASEGISLEKQPRYKVKKSKKEIGFQVRDGGGNETNI